MRCKNCKKKIDNPNFLRCPHCGKPIKKKKERNKSEYIFSAIFIAVAAAFAICNFIGFFMNWTYFYTPLMIVALILVIVSFPFIFSNELVKQSTSEIFAGIIALPFFANWVLLFLRNSESLDRGGLFSAFYIFMAISIGIPPFLLIFKIAKIVNGTVIQWICLALSILSAVSTIVFYSLQSTIGTFAIITLALQAIIPGYYSFHTLFKETLRR